ncbi:MAG: cell division protein FtsL [Geminicoccaceae bacterium]
MLKLGFASLMIAVLAGCGVYALKYRVQGLEKDLMRVERAQQKETIEIARLRAEWATLSQPGRLARLATKHLDLQPAVPRQMARIDDIPLRDTGEQENAPALVSSAATATFAHTEASPPRGSPDRGSLDQ